jgi:hypothetical protein
MNKKAQLKIQQMAFMLIAITIFFILAGMFILAIKYSSLQKDAEILRRENSMYLVSKIANSPEFSCGGAFGGDEIDCIDADKVMILKQSSEKYKDFWGIENIEIIKIPSESNTLCTLTNYPNCDRIQLFDKDTTGIGFSNFVSLCRKESFLGESYDKCDLAKVIISYESRG